MNALLSINEVKLSLDFITFIACKDENELQKYMKQASRKIAPTKLFELENLDGKCNVKVSDEKEAQYELIKENINLEEGLFKKLNTSLKYLVSEINIVSNRMEEISQTFRALYQASSQTKEIDKIKDSFKILSGILNTWSQSSNKISSLLSIDLKEYYSFIRKEKVVCEEVKR